MGTAAFDIRDQGRRDSIGVAVFGTWMVVGLFVDGWAHQANKPETFFTPWHGVLYSGFVAAMIWSVVDARRSGEARFMATADRLTTLGLIGFVAGAISDGFWHEVFGVEVDLEALLSPTHLLLMTGGLLMLSSPVRWALSGDGSVGERPTFTEFLPVLVPLTLCVSVSTFFTMYLGAHDPVARFDEDELGEAVGVAAVVARNLLVITPLLFARRHWAIPVGACTFLMGANALLMAALEGFDFPQFIIPFVIGGVVADVVGSRARVPTWVFAVVVPLATWTSYFVVHEVVWGMAWTVELWTGAIFLAVVSAYGIDSLLANRSVGTMQPARD